MRSKAVRPHVVFAGGGTAGHLFPGLAVAGRLALDAPGWRITFAGTGREFEWRYARAARFEYAAISCRPVPRHLRDVVAFLRHNLAGYRQAARLLAEQDVSVVIGLGGYASVPMARAAVRRGIPLILLEQNAFPGRATRWLAPTATLVCTCFEQARAHLDPRCSVRLTGNPLRPGLVRLAHQHSGADGNGHAHFTLESRRAGSNGHGRKRVLFVVGGSGGARSLNENVPRALAKVRDRLRSWQIVHQAGPHEVASTRNRYRQFGLDATVAPFVAEMTRVLSHTRLAISRSGGTTLAEFAAAGIPAILLPYPAAVDDHQRRNADVFAAAGACLTLDERTVNGAIADNLAGAMSVLLSDPARLATMAAAARGLAQPDATWDIATVIRQVAVGAAA